MTTKFFLAVGIVLSLFLCRLGWTSTKARQCLVRSQPQVLKLRSGDVRICICIRSGRDRDADLPSTDSSDKGSLRNDAEPPDTEKIQASVAFCCFLEIQK